MLKHLSSLIDGEKKKHLTIDYADNVLKQIDLGKEKNMAITPDLFKFNVKTNSTMNGNNVLSTFFTSPHENNIPKEAPIPLQNYKVETMKPIKIENAFGSTIVKSDVQPLVHKNPQKYEYFLDKYDEKA